MNLHEQKNAIRLELKQRRSSLSSEDRARFSQEITQKLQMINEFQLAKSIFCFISYLTEVDTTPLIQECLEKNIELSVPKIINKTRMIAVKIRNLEDLETDNMGILTPKHNDPPLSSIDIAITPGLGFTSRGERIGYGRGYYDRWFAENDVKTRIGICFETQLLESLPVEETDIKMDMIITESQAIDMRSP